VSYEIKVFIMLFIYPMWDHESQRIGKQKCSPFAYGLHVLADIIGGIGLFSLIGLGISDVFSNIDIYWWYYTYPFMAGAIGQIIHIYSWKIVAKKKFHYDYEKSIATWEENGEVRSFKY
jgi:hypothetical protein